MIENINIRILEKEANKRGDLFGKLMADLFHVLGYSNPRLNIHKSGRELDILAKHRIESRWVLAECKATRAKIGGRTINTFVGTLDAERREQKDQNILGYFVSLAGFKETAIEQEDKTGNSRVILIDGQQVVEELIKGHILISSEKAIEQATRCAVGQSLDVKIETYELLAHKIGWIWVVYFAKNKQKTHFALIAYDGEALAPSLAQAIIQADKAVRGPLHMLKYIPPVDVLLPEELVERAKEAYFNYLADECGYITLEGLPADQEVGSRRLALEHIFVPLYLTPLHVDSYFEEIIEDYDDEEEEEDYDYEDGYENETGNDDQFKRRQEKYAISRFPIGFILSMSSSPRLAILAPPGGGKTTLLKRLAILYAFPDRLNYAFPDNLYLDPHEHPCLPIFIRCRQLGDLARLPISDILQTIPNRAEIPKELFDAFNYLVTMAIRNGKILLLIDGLDEISDEGMRVSFVKQLRTFINAYRNVKVIVTSREAGFRIVSGVLDSYLEQYKLAELTDNDITDLTVAWHREVIGDRSDVIEDAKILAKTICDSDRVKLLAQNPMLLTTLLLVKRWVGQLPTKRSVLYAKAIEVLLMTWNVEGYEPIELDEAIPQLAFVAFTMMKEGLQRISSKQLKKSLLLARKQMPEILGFAKVNVPAFIERIELRSSLLIQSGYEVEDGIVCEVYEFRHLTFQEFLAALAITEEFYPDRTDDDTFLKILQPHLSDENWKEVVPLAAVLSGRKVRQLIQYLVDLCRKSPSPKAPFYSETFPVILLAQCILDEIQITPELLKECLEWIARRSRYSSDLIRQLYKSKYGEIFQQLVQDAYMHSNEDMLDLGNVLAEISLEKIGSRNLTQDVIMKITQMLQSSNSVQKTSGILAIMRIANIFEKNQKLQIALFNDPWKMLRKLGEQLAIFLDSEKQYLQFSLCWAIVWLGRTDALPSSAQRNILRWLVDVWERAQSFEMRFIVSMAIFSFPPLNRELLLFPEITSALIDLVKKKFTSELYIERFASLVIGFYLREPWPDKELALLWGECVRGLDYSFANYRVFLEALGGPGQAQLRTLEKERIQKRLSTFPYESFPVSRHETPAISLFGNPEFRDLSDFVSKAERFRREQRKAQI